MITDAPIHMAGSFADDQPFFVKAAIGIALVTIVCFVQLEVRGLIDPLAEPVWVHLHAMAMVSWLCLLVVQSVLATRNLRLHRILGRAGIGLVLVIVGLGMFTAIMSYRLHRSLPGASLPWDFTREAGALLAFVGLVAAGVVMRRDAQWHRRLMFGATIVLAINPALSRIMPVAMSIDPRSGWLIAAAEVGFIATMVRHDRKMFGTAHPATISVGLVILLSQVLMIAGAYNNAVLTLAQSLEQA